MILLSINAKKKEAQTKVAPGLQLRENGRTPSPTQFKQSADRLGPRPVEEGVMRQWRTRQPNATKASTRGTHRGQRSCETAPKGRTYDRKRLRINPVTVSTTCGRPCSFASQSTSELLKRALKATNTYVSTEVRDETRTVCVVRGTVILDSR